MRKLFILLLTVLAINSYGQNPPRGFPGVTLIPDTSTALKVVYINATRDGHQKPVAYYVNDQFVSEGMFSALKPDQIESLNVVKEDIEIDGVKYYGKILIKIKGNYAPKPISLNALKAKYTNLKDKATIFTVDGEIITKDYDRYLVDENFLFRIIVDKVEDAKEKVDLNVVKLLTKTEANIKRVNEIRIRGAK